MMEHSITILLKKRSSFGETINDNKKCNRYIQFIIEINIPRFHAKYEKYPKIFLTSVLTDE